MPNEREETYLTKDEWIKIGDLTRQCADACRIDPSLYSKYDVKKGLRDLDGRGVLAGLTEISEVKATEETDGKRVPAPRRAVLPRLQRQGSRQGISGGQALRVRGDGLSPAYGETSQGARAPIVLRAAGRVLHAAQELRARHHHEVALARHDEHPHAVRALPLPLRSRSQQHRGR